MNTDQKPILEYKTPQPSFVWSSIWTKPIPRRALFWIFAGLSLFLFLLISTIPVSFNASPEIANRVKCGSNLRQIGQAIQLYNADQKVIPDDYTKLVTQCDVSTEIFVCPATHDSPATQPADLKNAPNHCSYIFLFENKPMDFMKSPAETIIAFENPSNHDYEGMNALYRDGQVDWIPKDKMSYILSELTAGHNPPRTPQVAPAPSPAENASPAKTSPENNGR